MKNIRKNFISTLECFRQTEIFTNILLYKNKMVQSIHQNSTLVNGRLRFHCAIEKQYQQCKIPITEFPRCQTNSNISYCSRSLPNNSQTKCTILGSWKFLGNKNTNYARRLWPNLPSHELYTNCDIIWKIRNCHWR